MLEWNKFDEDIIGDATNEYFDQLDEKAYRVKIIAQVDNVREIILENKIVIYTILSCFLESFQLILIQENFLPLWSNYLILGVRKILQ